MFVRSDTGLKEDAGEYWGIRLLSKSALIYASWVFMFFLHLSLSSLIFFSFFPPSCQFGFKAVEMTTVKEVEVRLHGMNGSPKVSCKAGK